ncbi:MULTISPECIES: hypothetical protein [unclassified Colwellia]|uniref:hypothetical protein n=1 Tax=unclassified Colwellia TaxID=196834 RepID=UPI0015F70755|nr:MULTISPECIES: hypothetical protein [unclassified Colwellia]MBA6353773.1 hypothetical protein [Colwellia sp. BRX9-1]MBA6357583.1 hypothetical protein [Colwellia sp. BRX8-3]MBA6361379.1 hypothetical protein [Colwellia sp. BRX8-6]MBA6369330.1 hypothetical protein [Colwellia sp. BRX8-5]MBA6375778.1 hypothetical protein [Colwellia sp. BRX8-2]|tara:strand:+ start:887 stop:1099 length:213 start_codon:yes stop_codon:yes gene_type:complete
MLDITQFNLLKKSSAKSFNDQKALIKKVMAGREMKCETCGSILRLIVPEDKSTPGVYCGKGCTDICLDFI